MVKYCNACGLYPSIEGKDKCESCHGILKYIADNWRKFKKS